MEHFFHARYFPFTASVCLQCLNLYREMVFHVFLTWMYFNKFYTENLSDMLI